MVIINSSISPLKRLSLATEIANSLRQLISSGQLPPETHLVESDLATQIGVSRGPLREALRILESEGLVASIPNRGSYVASLSKEDIIEVYSLRSILEQEAVRLAAKESNSSQIEILDQILKQMFIAAEQNNIQQVIDLDLSFHWQIWEMAGHRRLKQVLESISSQVKRYLSVQTTLYDDLVAGIEDHSTILEAIKNCEGERSAQLMKQHLDSASQVVINYAKTQTHIS